MWSRTLKWGKQEPVGKVTLSGWWRCPNQYLGLHNDNLWTSINGQDTCDGLQCTLLSGVPLHILTTNSWNCPCLQEAQWIFFHVLTQVQSAVWNSTVNWLHCTELPLPTHTPHSLLQVASWFPPASLPLPPPVPSMPFLPPWPLASVSLPLPPPDTGPLFWNLGKDCGV